MILGFRETTPTTKAIIDENTRMAFAGDPLIY